MGRTCPAPCPASTSGSLLWLFAGCDVLQTLGFLLPFGLSVKAACPNFGTGHGNLLLGACSQLRVAPGAVKRGFFSPAKLPHGTALCTALRRALPSLSL